METAVITHLNFEIAESQRTCTEYTTSTTHPLSLDIPPFPPSLVSTPPPPSFGSEHPPWHVASMAPIFRSSECECVPDIMSLHFLLVPLLLSYLELSSASGLD